MLTSILFRLFTLLFGGVVTETAPPPPVVQLETIETERVAQVRLAEVLGTADAIHAVTAKRKQITFVISRGEQVFRVVATTTKKGDVTRLDIVPIVNDLELNGGLSWLAEELEAVTAVTRLVADEDGAVTITTSDNRRYMAIPGRGSGGSNTAAEARWAAEWNKG